MLAIRNTIQALLATGRALAGDRSTARKRPVSLIAMSAVELLGDLVRALDLLA
jgi:hypothetical protein